MLGGIEQLNARHWGLSIALLAMAAVGISLVVADEAQALDVTQNVCANTRWRLLDSPVNVLNTITIRCGATLTIDPGVEVRFRPDAYIQVSERWGSGTMNALGTAAQPVTFRSSTGLRDWPGLYFYGPDTTMAATLSNVTVRDVRGNGIRLDQWRNVVFSDVTVQDTTQVGVYVGSSSLTWRAGRVDRAGSHGVYLAASTLTVRDLTILDAASYGIYAESDSRAIQTRVTIDGAKNRVLRANMIDDLSTLTVRNSAVPHVELWGTTMTSNVRLRKLSDAVTGTELRYVMLAGFHVRGGATLTIDPGVDLHFRSGQVVLNSGYVCCWGYENGRIVALGTATEPIRLTSDDSGRSWNGLYFYQGRDGTMPTRLENVTIEHVSGTALDVRSGSTVVLKNSVLRDASSHGAYVEGSTLTATASRFEDNGGFGLIIDSGAALTATNSQFNRNEWPMRARLGSGILGSTFDGNRFQVIQVWGNTLTSSFTLARMTDATTGGALNYRLLSDVAVENGATLTIAPGVRIESDSNVGFNVGRYYCSWWDCSPRAYDAASLVAVGTPTMPIVFTSSSAFRTWDGIYVDGRHTPAANRLPVRLDNVIIEKSQNYGLGIESHPDTRIVNSIVRDNAGAGVAMWNSRSFLSGATTVRDWIHDNTISGNGGSGVYLANADPSVLHNALSGNSGFGLETDPSGTPTPFADNAIVSNARPIRVPFAATWRTNSFTGSATKTIEFWGTTFSASQTLDHFTETGGARHAYAFVSNVLVRDRAVFTIVAGIDLDLRGNELRAGTNSWRESCVTMCGSLVARGTAAEPITIRGGRIFFDNEHNNYQPQVLENVVIRDTPGDGLQYNYLNGQRFTNLRFENTARSVYGYGSSNVVFDNVDWVAPRGNAVELYYGGTTSILNSRFTNVAGHGVYANGGYVVIRGNTFTNTGGFAIYMEGGTPGDVRNNLIDGTRGVPLRVPMSSALYTNEIRNPGVTQIQFSYGDVTSSLTLLRRPFTDAREYTYRVFGDVTVRNAATLSVEKGQGILFEPGVSLYVGTGSSPGGLLAEGTASDPIRFTSYTTWSGIWMDGTATGEVPSRLVNAVVERSNRASWNTPYGGLNVVNHQSLVVDDSTFRDNFGVSGIWAQGSRFTLTDSFLEDNGVYGVSLLGGNSPSLTGNTFRRNQYGVATYGSDAPSLRDNLFADQTVRAVAVSVRTAADLIRNQYENNALDEIIVSGGDVAGSSARLYLLSDNATGEELTYVITGDIRVFSGGKLTLDPGTDLRFTADRNLQVGWYDRWYGGGPAGELVADGTPDAPITLTSYRGLYEWDGLYFDGRNGGANVVSTLDNVIVQRTRSYAFRTYSHSGLRMTDSIVRENGGTAFYVEGGAPQIADVQVLRSGGYGFDVRSASPVLTGVTIDRSGSFAVITDQAASPEIRDSIVSNSGDRPMRLSPRTILGADNRLDQNRYPEIEIYASTSGGSYPVQADRTLPRLVDATTGEAAPYVVIGRIEVFGATFAVDPGVTMRFQEALTYDWWGRPTGYFDGIQVGSGSTSGALAVRGTPSDPVTFTSDTLGRTWGGVSMDGRGAARASSVANLLIEKSRGDGLYAYRVPSLTVSGLVAQNNGGSGVSLVESPALVTDSNLRANGNHGAYVETANARLLRNTLANNTLGGAAVSGSAVSTPTLEGNVFRGNKQAGILAANAVRPVVTENKFEGAGRAIGMSNLATPLDVAGGDAGAAGIMDGLFRPRNGGTNWFYLTPQAFNARKMVLVYDGPAGSSMDSTLRHRYATAEFDVETFATSDGRSLEKKVVRSDAAGNLAFSILLDGGRRSVVDVVPVVGMDFEWLPFEPTVEIPAEFHDLTTVQYGDVVRRAWSFGDGDVAVGDVPTHQFARKKSYLVTLTVTLDSGRTYSRTEPLIVVNAPPHAETFFWDVQRPAELEAVMESRATMVDDILFVNNSYDTDGFVVSWSWTFGDAQSATEANPIHRYEWAGPYEVCLTVMDNDLAFDTACKVLQVWSPKTLADAEGMDRVEFAQGEVSTAEGRVTAAQAEAETQADVALGVANDTAVDVQDQAHATIAFAGTTADTTEAAARAAAAAEEAFATGHKACVEATVDDLQGARFTPTATCGAALAAAVSARGDAAIDSIREVLP